MRLSGRTYIARHAETVFNAGGRMQGRLLHTPLTRTGFAQAEAMGTRLRAALGARPSLTLWCSPAGRTLQTLAVICEHLELDWHTARVDERLLEIDMGGWDGRPYSELEAEHGPIYDRALALFVQRPPGGEAYADVAARLRSWVTEQESETSDRLIVTHGVAAVVLRAVLTGEGRTHPVCGTLVAGPVPQGSVMVVEDGRERVVVEGISHA